MIKSCVILIVVGEILVFVISRQFFKLVSPPSTRGEYLETLLSMFSAQYLRCNSECGLPQGKMEDLL